MSFSLGIEGIVRIHLQDVQTITFGRYSSLFSSDLRVMVTLFISVVFVAYTQDMHIVTSLLSHCKEEEGRIGKRRMRKRRRKMCKNASFTLTNFKMPYKYMRVCPVCQRPNVINLSSHLSMVHGLNGHERIT